MRLRHAGEAEGICGVRTRAEHGKPGQGTETVPGGAARPPECHPSKGGNGRLAVALRGWSRGYWVSLAHARWARRYRSTRTAYLCRVSHWSRRPRSLEREFLTLAQKGGAEDGDQAGPGPRSSWRSSAQTAHLRQQIGDRAGAFVICGDCNQTLPNGVFPKVRWEDYRRGLCLLGPYGLHLEWRLVEMAGKMRTIDLFLNIPVMGMNRNALWRDPTAVSPDRAARLTSFWGDESWRQQVYRASSQTGLFGGTVEEVENADVAEAFRKRLQSVARFAHVPPPMPMKNQRGAIVYYLFCATRKGVANTIVTSIFNEFRRHGV
jgi:three-Cys-motif partner protein